MADKEKAESACVCRSVFKSGESTTSKRQFTKKWIELINKVEKGKGVTLAQ